MRAIILAAGMGTRMGEGTVRIPKCLLPVGTESILERLVSQLKRGGVTDITIVVGHQRGAIESEIHQKELDVAMVVNDRYREDTNILSLTIGMRGRPVSTLVVEADVIITDNAMERITALVDSEASHWFTVGPFLSHEYGGILSADASGCVTDIRIVPSYRPELADYRKLVGLLHIGPNEAPRFLNLLEESVARSTQSYYLRPWIDNLEDLPSREVRLSRELAGSFNTHVDYTKVVNTVEW